MSQLACLKYLLEPGEVSQQPPVLETNADSKALRIGDVRIEDPLATATLRGLNIMGGTQQLEGSINDKDATSTFLETLHEHDYLPLLEVLLELRLTSPFVIRPIRKGVFGALRQLEDCPVGTSKRSPFYYTAEAQACGLIKLGHYEDGAEWMELAISTSRAEELIKRSSTAISPSNSLTVLPDRLVPPTFRSLVETLRCFTEGSATQSEFVANFTKRKVYLWSYEDGSFEDYLKEAVKYRIILMVTKIGSDEPTIQLKPLYRLSTKIVPFEYLRLLVAINDDESLRPSAAKIEDKLYHLPIHPLKREYKTYKQYATGAMSLGLVGQGNDQQTKRTWVAIAKGLPL